MKMTQEGDIFQLWKMDSENEFLDPILPRLHCGNPSMEADITHSTFLYTWHILLELETPLTLASYWVVFVIFAVSEETKCIGEGGEGVDQRSRWVPVVQLINMEL